MKYYKVKSMYDNTQVYTRYKNYIKYHSFLVGNELKTEAEYKKLLELSVKNIANCFEVVNVNKNDTFFFFGARFV